jgi:hypothetical protein
MAFVLSTFCYEQPASKTERDPETIGLTITVQNTVVSYSN